MASSVIPPPAPAIAASASSRNTIVCWRCWPRRGQVRPDFQVFSVGWGWKFRSDPAFFSQQAALPAGAGLTTLPDGEAWSFDRKLTDALVNLC